MKKERCVLTNKNISFIILLFFIGTVSASCNIYSGNNCTISLEDDDYKYIITGNSSDLDGLWIENDGENFILSFPINYKPDNFNIVFYKPETKEVIKKIRVGGGTNTVYKNRNITKTEIAEIDKIIEKEKVIKNCSANENITENCPENSSFFSEFFNFALDSIKISFVLAILTLLALLIYYLIKNREKIYNYFVKVKKT